MKLTTTRLITSLVLFAAVAMTSAMFLLGPSASHGVVKAQEEDQDARSRSRGGRLEGTWRVHVTQRNCQTGAELRTFPALLAFAEGGTMTGSTTAFPASLRGSDQGVWNHNGGRRYGAVSEAFLFSPAGAWVSTQRITQAIQIGPGQDSFTSDAAVEFFDTAGNVTLTGCATAVATRME
jgi:hypothetical protein